MGLRALLVLVLCAGCTTQTWRERHAAIGFRPTAELLATADYGQLPGNWRELALGAVRLDDPRDVEFFPPERGYAVFRRHRFAFGWQVDFDVTARNRLGGLSRATISVLVRDGRAVAYKDGPYWRTP